MSVIYGSVGVTSGVSSRGSCTAFLLVYGSRLRHPRNLTSGCVLPTSAPGGLRATLRPCLVRMEQLRGSLSTTAGKRQLILWCHALRGGSAEPAHQKAHGKSAGQSFGPALPSSACDSRRLGGRQRS